MKKIRWGALVAYIVLAIFAIITVFPFVYMILGGLMSFRETTTIPPTLIPKHFEWSNYAKVFAQAPCARYFLNTFITASVTTIVSLFNALLGAFAMVNLKFKGKGVFRSFAVERAVDLFVLLAETDFAAVVQKLGVGDFSRKT